MNFEDQLQEAVRQSHQEFMIKAKKCLPNPSAMLDFAFQEVAVGHWGGALRASLMTVKMYAAQQYEHGKVNACLENALRATMFWGGEITVNGVTTCSNFISKLLNKPAGKNAILVAGETLEPYHLIGISYFSFRPEQFLAYNIPYSWVSNFRLHVAGDPHGPDFTGRPGIINLMDCVGYIVATSNCPDSFPIPWTCDDMEKELTLPVNMNVFVSGRQQLNM